MLIVKPLLKKIISVVATALLLGIELERMADNPEHYLHPDLDCPICNLVKILLIKTYQHLVPLQLSNLFISLLDSYPAAIPALYFWAVSIRGPPFSA